MYRRILLLSCGDLPAPWVLDKLQRLVASAESSEVRIALFGFTDSILAHFFEPVAGVDSLVRKLAEALEEQVLAALPAGLRARVAVEVNDRPLTESSLADTTQRFAPDLVVKRCSYHHRLDQYLLGHMDWTLIRQTEVPLLLLRPARWSAAPRIVVAVDPLRAHHQPPGLDRQIVRQADRLAELIGAECELVHVYQPLPMAVILDDSLMLDYGKLQRRMRGEHQRAMAQFAEQEAATVASFGGQVTLLHGEVAAQIAAHCRQRTAAVVVVGRVRHAPWEVVFVGSTLEDLIDQVEVDLLVIPA